MTIRTRTLDKAAFYTCFGGTILEILGKYPENEFIIIIPRWLRTYESIGGWVPYNRFCNERRSIKRMTRRKAGLPEYFTGGKKTGFKLGDIAIFKPWSKRDKLRGINR